MRIAALAAVFLVGFGCAGVAETSAPGSVRDVTTGPPTCATNEDCTGNEYCAKPAGECDASGVCRARPEICTQEYEPICACDGKVYSNACMAASAGSNVRRTGECEGANDRE